MKKRITIIILGLFCFTAVVMLAFSIRVFTTSNIGPIALLLGGPEEELAMITNANQQSVADSETQQQPTESAADTIQPTSEPTATPTPTPEPTPTPTPEPTINPVEEQFPNGKLNVLLLGWDQSPERGDQNSELYRDEKNNYRSDVMILLAIDFDQNKIDMISIPRDSYAEVYNVKGKWKINAAFAKGGSAEGMGFEYAMKTISMLMGDVPIDYYVGVEMEGFKGVVDAMGGVDYDVDVKITLNKRVLETGFQHLDGQQVLDYCRARKGISTDIGRIDRQQRILFSIFNQMKSADQILNIPKIYKAVADMLYTNLSVEQIAALAVFANGLDENSMQRYTLEGEYMNAYGANFYVLKQEYKNQLIKDIYGFEAPFDKEHDISYVRSQNSKSKKK